MVDSSVVNGGVEAVLNYDNIAIIVLMLMVIFEGSMLIMLLRGLLKTKDILAQLNTTIAILNERIRHYDDEGHD